MKKMLKILLGVILVVYLAGVSFAESSIGYIDVQKVFNDYEKTKAAQADIKEKEKELQDVLEEKQKEIEKAKEEGKTDKELSEMIDKFSEEVEPQKQKLMELRGRLTSEIQGDIVKASTSAGKELGIDIVLDKQVFITGGIDLTDLVLEKLNE